MKKTNLQIFGGLIALMLGITGCPGNDVLPKYHFNGNIGERHIYCTEKKAYGKERFLMIEVKDQNDKIIYIDYGPDLILDEKITYLNGKEIKDSLNDSSGTNQQEFDNLFDEIVNAKTLRKI